MLEFLLVQSSGPGQTSPCIFLCAMIFRPETTMQKRRLPGARGIALSIAWATGMAARPVCGQDKLFKIGLIFPMAGQQATTGRQIEAAAKLYMAQNGDTVAGPKVQFLITNN